MSEPDEPDEVQFCSYCSEPFPMDDPMVDYDGQTFCSPDCVRALLADDEPCDHAGYVAAVRNFNDLLGRVMMGGDNAEG